MNKANIRRNSGFNGGRLMKKAGESSESNAALMSTMDTGFNSGGNDYKLMDLVNEIDGTLYFFRTAGDISSSVQYVRVDVYNAGADWQTTNPVATSGRITYRGQDYIDCTLGGLTQGNYYDVYYFEYTSRTYSWWAVLDWQMTQTLPTPTNLNFDTNSYVMSATSNAQRVAFLWGEVDTSSVRFSSYTPEERQYFYSICLNHREYTNFRFDEAFSTILMRWNKPNVRYKTTFRPSAAGSASYYNGLVSSTINELNNIVSGGPVQFSLVTSGDYDIEVEFGTAEELGFIEPDYRYNGKWENQYDYSTGEIYWGKVQIATNPIAISLMGIIHEEMAQVLGAGNDGNTYKYSCFYEHQFDARPSTYPAIDQKVLRMLYCEGLPMGASSSRIARIINCLAIDGGIGGTNYKSLNFDRNFLKPNTQYKYQAWAVNYNHAGADFFSRPTGYTNFTTPNTAFTWKYAGIDNNGNIVAGNQKATGYGFYMKADNEWTEFQNSINEKLWDRGKSQFSFFPDYHGDGSFTIATAGRDFYYYYFNQVRNAILDLNPNAALPPAKKKGDPISATELNQLVNAFNAS